MLKNDDEDSTIIEYHTMNVDGIKDIRKIIKLIHLVKLSNMAIYMLNSLLVITSDTNQYFILLTWWKVQYMIIFDHKICKILTLISRVF
jgi:hypothetical protein